MDEYSSQATESLIDGFNREPSPVTSSIPLEFTDLEKQQLSVIFNGNMCSYSNKNNECYEWQSNARYVQPETTNSPVFKENDGEDAKIDNEILPFGILDFILPEDEATEQLYDFVDELISDEDNIETADPRYVTDLSSKKKQVNTKMKTTRKKSSLMNERQKDLVSFRSITQQDVLYGRGERTNNHEGNKYFRKIVSSMASKYKTCSRSDKSVIANSIIDVIHERGGRFLAPIPNSNSWNIVKGREIKRKTSHALRDKVLLLNKRNPSFFMNMRQKKSICHRSITPHDVLFGRGYGTNNHEGNKYFRSMVSSMASKYKSSSKSEKTDIAKHIIDVIHKRGGRFLAPFPNTNLWNIVEGREMRKKTSQALRDTVLLLNKFDS